MLKSDKHVLEVFTKDGYLAHLRAPCRIEVTKRKPNAMRVYVEVKVGEVFKNKCQVKVVNYTDSTEFKEIFDKYDSVVYQFDEDENPQNVLTVVDDSDIMLTSTEEIVSDGTFASLFD